MGALNKKNFLRWEGSFTQAPHTNTANDSTATGPALAPNILLYPLANDVCTFGINPASFKVTSHDNPNQPPVWNGETSVLTYFPPSTTPGIHVINYQWRDMAGNLSNIASITITLL